MRNVQKSGPHLPLRSRMAFSYTALMLVWVLIFVVYSSIRTQIAIEDQVRLSLQSSLTQSSIQIQNRIKEMRDMAHIVVMNVAFQNAPVSYSWDTGSVDDRIAELESYYREVELLSAMRQVYREYDLRLYMDDRALQAREGTFFFPISRLKDMQWVESLNRHTSTLALTDLPDVHDNGTNALKDAFAYVSRWQGAGARQFSNLIVISIPRKRLEQTLLATYAQQGGQMLLFREGEQGYDMLKGDYGSILTDSGEYIAMSTSPLPGWKLIATMPKSVMTQPVQKLRHELLSILAVTIIVSMLLALVFSQQFSYRIKSLVDSMRNMGQDGQIREVAVHGDDEVGLIERTFNDMSRRLQLLIYDVRRSEKEKREAELRALQAQINPHFLYNTLDAINWMAAAKGEMVISSMAVSLGRFFRMSLSGGRELIRLSAEMEMTDLYVQIQKLRMGDVLEVSYDIDEDVKDCLCVKLLIQPLVENAVKHGFKGMDGQKISIVISARREEDWLICTVEDNGAGLSSAAQCGLSDSDGYGLKNVQLRLKLSFGEDASLRLTPGSSGIGAKVCMRWRCRRAMDEPVQSY